MTRRAHGCPAETRGFSGHLKLALLLLALQHVTVFALQLDESDGTSGRGSLAEHSRTAARGSKASSSRRLVASSSSSASRALGKQQRSLRSTASASTAGLVRSDAALSTKRHEDNGRSHVGVTLTGEQGGVFAQHGLLTAPRVFFGASGASSVQQPQTQVRNAFIDDVAHPVGAFAVTSLLIMMIILIFWSVLMRLGCVQGLGKRFQKDLRALQRQHAVAGLLPRSQNDDGAQRPEANAPAPALSADPELDDLFKRATDEVNPNPVLKARFDPLSNADKLKVYGMYRQGQDGDVVGDRPGMFDIVERAKYDAWAELLGMAQDDAKREFVAKCDEMAPGWRNWQPELEAEA